jgi:hypothetical protein
MPIIVYGVERMSKLKIILSSILEFLFVTFCTVCADKSDWQSQL